MPFTKKNREAISALAVSYQAYIEAVDKGLPGLMSCWASILLKAQQDTGVELVAPVRLQSRIDAYTPDRQFRGVEIYANR